MAQLLDRWTVAIMRQTATAGDVTDAGSGEQPDLVRVFVDLLDRYPDALVAAVGDDGLTVPMPPSVPLHQHRLAVSRSVLDMVIAADKVEVITTWERSRREGGASMIAHLLTDPGQPVLLTFVDATERFGTHLAIFLPVDGRSGRSVDGSPAGVAMPRTARIKKNELAVIVDVDEATALILGWPRDEMIGRRSLDFVHPDDQERGISNWMEMLTAPGHDQRVRLRHRTADGSWVWMEVTNRNQLDADPPCVLAEMLDISEELAAQEALRASEERLRRLASALPVGVLQIERDRTISNANQRLHEITGSDDLGSIDAQFRHLLPGDHTLLLGALDHVLEFGADHDLQVQFAVDGERDGVVRHCTVSLRPLTDERGEVTDVIVCVTDVSEQVRLTAELERQATFDSLTGCYNRAALMTRLEAMIVNPNSGVAVVFVDLDGFKAVNDLRGHAAGDELLAGVADRLRQSVRDGDIVGRVGGDEFVVVCRNVADDEETDAVGRRIDAKLGQGVQVGDDVLVVHASLGLAHTTGGTTAERLVADADTRMYEAKRERKRRIGD